MSILEVSSPLLRVRPWADPVLDRLGHDPRDTYCERFWLPLLGPSAVLLTRQLADRLEQEPEGFAVATDDASRALGLGAPNGRRCAFHRTVQRLAQFKLLHHDDDGTLLVRRRLPGLSRTQVLRLPRGLREAHDDWAAAASTTPALPVLRERARALAVSLLQLGESREEVGRHLRHLRFDPPLCREAVAWAEGRLGGRVTR